ncbi:hypothetical protein TruAng_007401 [Truncatella angustata]|nr:hypothetical protein TruAng_007401 [Truncatella angustata]
MDLPYVISPVGENDFAWLVLQRFLGSFLETLPFGLGRFVRYTKRGWNWSDKNKAHKELGKVFIVVSPSGNDLHVGDAAATDFILSRRKDFLKPLELAKLIDVFGQSVISSEGSDWQRHRRVTAPPFNERNSQLVWGEALRQSVQMLEHWNSKIGGTNVTTTLRDTAKLALNVLMCAGFGMTYSFRDSLDDRKDGFGMSYRDALETCMSDVLMVFVVPASVFSLPWLPKKLTKYKMAVADLKRYLQDMVAAAKVKAKEHGSTDADLLSNLVRRARDVQMENSEDETLSQNSLSDSEIHGNLFMFSFAGHETMATTLEYAIYLLAAFPEWQEWVGAEIDEVFKAHESIETLDYEELYPKLKRCRAVMVGHDD